MPATLKGPGLFLAQFAGDAAPFDTLDNICRWAAGLGYKGVQIPTWDSRLFDLARAAESQAYCDEVAGTAAAHGLAVTELSTHLQGQLVAVNPAYDEAFDAFAPEAVRGRPAERQAWAVDQVTMAARASRRLGLAAGVSFTGALLWPFAYPAVGTSEMKVLGLSMAVLFVVAVPAMGADGLTAFTGRWQVAGVAVPDVGVQALADNDPSLMGKRLTFTPQRLDWDQPTATKDACVGPTFTRLSAKPSADLLPQLRKLRMRQPVAYSLRCRSGSWGPGDQTTVYLGAAGAIAMPWYDNGILKLVR